MADHITFKAEGFKELEEVLVQMGNELGYDKASRRVLVPAVKSALDPVLTQARFLSPYDEKNSSDHHMRDTLKIHARNPTTKDQRSGFVERGDAVIGTVSVRTDQRAISQEFGNARVDAQPFLRASLESRSNDVINRLGTFLTYKLQQYKSKKA